MKTIYFMIFVFLILLFYLDYREKNYYHNQNNQNNQQIENYCNKSDNSLNRTLNNSNSINLGKKQTNFTTNGLNPFLKCPQCFMNFDCSNYPFTISDKYNTLCTTCIDKNSDMFKNKVLSKQPGRPRNCQNIYL
jgi:hypothetical protein